MTTFTHEDLNNRYENFTSVIRCDCTLITELVGGLPAEEPAIRMYVKYQLNIPEESKEYEEAVQRILKHEVEPSTPPEGELPEGKLYGLLVIRKQKGCPYLGDWMVKAALKGAASRMGIFQQISGSKGAFAESGRVRAWRNSLRDEANLICLTNADGSGPADTYFREFMGRVSTPQGMMSIVHRSECVPPGSRFAFEFRFMPVKDLTDDALRDVLSLVQNVGVGSARALERGKFRIDYAEIDQSKVYRAKPETVKKPEMAKPKAKEVVIAEPVVA